MPRRWIQVKPITDLQGVLGYQFKNPDLFLQAATHASAISEQHPMAFYHHQKPLAFVGDAALKYAVARYIFLNGRPDMIGDVANFHEGSQAVVPNLVLATIAEKQLHLEEYLIRGYSNEKLSVKMYADFMEAILGAIALDCGTNEQEVIFRVIEKFCARQYENLLRPTLGARLASAVHEDEMAVLNNPDWLRGKVVLMLYNSMITSPSDERSCLQMLRRIFLWFFTICGVCGLLMFCWT